MADNVGSIFISLDLDSKAFKSGLAEARVEANRFSSSVSDYFNNSVDASRKLTAGLVALGAGLSATVIGFAKIAGNLESARQGFVNLLGSAEKADDIIAQIKKDATETPFEIAGLIQANLLLTSVTKNGQQSQKILLDVGKALASAGKGQAELDRVIMNLQQIGLTGKITAMDIRQFGSAGINVLEILADYYGVTAGRAVEMVQESQNAFADLEGAFAKASGAGGRFEKAFILQAGTFNQLVSNMKDSISIFGVDVLKQTGIFDALKNAMSIVIDYLNNNKETISDAIVNALKWIQENGETVAGVISGIVAPSIIKSVAGIVKSLLTLSPWIIVFTLLGVAIGYLIDHFGGLEQTIVAVTDWIRTNAQPVIDMFNYAWEVLQPSVVALANTFMNDLLPQLQRMWDLIAPVLIPLLQDLAVLLGVAIVGVLWILVNTLNIVISVLAFFINTWLDLREKALSVADAIRNKWQEFTNWITSLRDRIYEGIVGGFRDAFNWIQRNVDKVKEALNKINPWARQSPSLIDNIQSGSNQIIAEYSNMFNKLNEMSVGARPQLMATGLATGVGTNISTSIFGNISINNRADADYLLSRISYDDDIVSRGLTA